MRLPSLLRGLVALLSFSLSFGVLLGPGPASASTIAGHPRVGANWLIGQLDATSHLMPNQYGSDYGMSIDTLFELAPYPAASSTVDSLGAAIEAGYWNSYIQYHGVFYANSTAKALVAARVLRRPATDFGGHNLRAKLLSMVAPSGRVRDTDWASAPDYSNTLGQSFAVIGLARSGGVPQQVVDYLLRQQCPSGGFAQNEARGKTCAQAGHRGSVDTTGLAIQALVAAKKHGASVPAGTVRAAARWLVSVQRDNGGFNRAGGKARPNTNSTGYAAAGLAAVHRTAALERAAGFVAGLQLTSANSGKASADIGAVAYDRPAFKAAVTDGVTPTTRDQFRRATSQALLALTGHHLDVLRRR